EQARRGPQAACAPPALAPTELQPAQEEVRGRRVRGEEEGGAQRLERGRKLGSLLADRREQEVGLDVEAVSGERGPAQARRLVQVAPVGRRPRPLAQLAGIRLRERGRSRRGRRPGRRGAGRRGGNGRRRRARLGPAATGALVLLAVEERALEPHRLERAEELRGGLGRAHGQPAAGDERLPESRRGGPLGLGREVEEDVPAEDHVHRAGVRDDGRVAVPGQVQRRERDHPADLGIELEALGSSPAEVAVDDGGRRVARGPAPVDAPAGALEPFRVDVGGEDGDRPVRPVPEQAVDEDRERVGLLAARAAGAPEAEPRGAGGAPAVDQGGQDLPLERLEAGAVAEEVGLADREGARELPPGRALVGEALEPAQVPLRRGCVRGPGRTKQRPLELGPPAQGEVEAEPLGDQGLRPGELAGETHGSTASSAVARSRSSSRERKESRSQMTSSPSARAATPSTWASRGSTAAGGRTSSAVSSRSPSTSSTARATTRLVVRATRRCAEGPYSRGSQPSRRLTSRTGVTSPPTLSAPSATGGAPGRGDTAAIGRTRSTRSAPRASRSPATANATTVSTPPPGSAESRRSTWLTEEPR